MSIVDQLQSYCTCVKDVTEEEVAELVNMVSLATCWMRTPCETFLTGERTELIDLPSCMDCPMEFYPLYHPYDKDSFEFTLIKVEGITETETAVTNFSYSKAKGGFLIEPGLPSCKCSSCSCGCDPEYKLLVKYTAGYDELPDCLLPVFCNVLEVIKAKRDCKCDDCGCSESYEENVQYAEGDVVTVALDTDIGNILLEQYKKQLSMISICRPQPGLWGCVV